MKRDVPGESSDSTLSAVGSEPTQAGEPPAATSVANSLARGAAVGRYVILSRLGGGGMGVVYAAYDPDLDRKVAIKLLRPGRRTDAASEGRARLMREAQAMARLDHPNVVGVLDVGTFEDQVFIAMELVDGLSLMHWMRQGHRWRDVRERFIQAGRGLAAAHAAGIVHRDFKPDNVVIGKDGRARVLDFGLARAAKSEADTEETAGPDGDVSVRSGSGSLERTLTQTGSLLGTPSYMSPEQWTSQPADAKSDQFSFCVAPGRGSTGGVPLPARRWDSCARPCSRQHPARPMERTCRRGCTTSSCAG
jgi:serine/threonine protein kinase